MIINPYSFVSYDPDAQAFFTAAGITDNTQKTAVNQLVLDLKSYSLWSKFSAIYPYVGGTATTHKFNLKNPLDTNAAFRILWVGGVTHTSNGIVGNGTNGYGETYVQPSTNLTQNSSHLAFWSKTNSQITASEMGYSDTLLNAGFRIATRNASNQASYQVNDNVNTIASSVTDSTGFWIASRTASNSRKLYRNGSPILTNTTVSTGISAVTIPVLAFKSYTGALAGYAAKTHSFASIGQGFNDTEAANFYTAVNLFQTTLGR